MSDIGITQASLNTYIGVDIGGTSTRIGLFDSLDASDFVLLANFPTQQSYEQQLRQIIATIRGSNIKNLAGIGVSVAARIHKDGDTIILPRNLPGNIGKQLPRDWIAQLTF